MEPTEPGGAVVHYFKHFGLVVSLLILVYVAFGIAAIFYYMKTRCPYSTLTACQAASVDKCGSDTVNGSGDCDRFVLDAEPCFCHECRFCLNANQRAHCSKPAGERRSTCTSQLTSVEDAAVASAANRAPG